MKSTAIACCAAVLLTAASAAPLVLLDEGHVDISWAYQDGAWSTSVFDEENHFPPINLPLDQVVFVAKDGLFADGAGSRWSRPAGAAWDITGNIEGQDTWILPSSNQGVPILEPGFNTYDVPFGLAEDVRIQLVAVEFAGEGDGHFSLMTNINQVHMATSDGIDGSDFYVMGLDDHRHAAWVFGSRGIYRISLTAGMLLVPGDESSRTTSAPQTVTFAVGLSPFELWLLERGVAPEESGESASPAGDGVPNLVKYALALDPFTPVAAPPAPLLTTTADGTIYPELDVALNPGATDVVVRVEVSDNLADWHSGNGHTVVLAHDAGRLHVRDAVPLGGAARRFLRLAVERAPEDDGF